MKQFLRVLGLLVLTGQARADLIVLKNGNELRGKIIEESARHVLIELPYGKMTIQRREIAEIIPEKDHLLWADEARRLLYHRWITNITHCQIVSAKSFLIKKEKAA